MWSSTVGLVNGKHRYLTAETFGFKINSNGQQLKRRQQWTIEPFPEITGPDGSISSAASVCSQSAGGINNNQVIVDTQDLSPCTILTPLVNNNNNNNGATPTLKPSSHDSNCSSAGADPDGYAGEEHENVALKSHLNKYLAVDSFGNVTCDSDEKTENARFTITICSMSQGRSKDEHIFWAFKNVERGYYLGTTDDGMICCSAKMPRSRAELWHLHLLPARGASFFALKSLGRKRFARLNSETWSLSDHQQADKIASQDTEAQVQLDANLSWGSETLFQFKYHEGGRYSLLTASDNRLLTNEGKCITWTATGEADSPPPECLFTLEYHSGYLAFRDSFGQYLAAAGRSSVLRSRSVGVSRDELFAFEGVPVQVSFRATFNNRWVSIKQGVDLTANQSETTTRHETFQLTYHKLTHNWSIMTHDCNYWTIAGQTGSGANANNNNSSANQSTVSVCRPADYEGHTRGQFKLIWSDLDEPTVSLKYVDVARQERWIAARKSGQLYLAPPGGGVEPVKFIMRLQNRRLLNLRPVEGSGFVGLRSNGGGAKQQLESNKTTPDSIVIEYDQRTSQADPSAATPTLAPSSDANGKTISTSANYNREAEKNQNSNQVINVFNVKLNNTKLGQSVFDKFTATNQTANQNYQSPEATHNSNSSNNNNNIYESPKELECETIDANNNCMEDQNHPNSNHELESEAPPGGGVESSSAPSVASIINSFSSNVKLSNSGRVSQQVSTSGGEQPTRGVAVSRLASSFEASRTTSSSAPAAAAAVPQVEAESPIVQQQQSYTNECCYLKIHSSGNYLTIEGGPQGGAVLCDATSKLSAQAWRLELRSHNCIAIRASDTRAYMQLGTNGIIQMARCEPHEASLWEF